MIVANTRTADNTPNFTCWTLFNFISNAAEYQQVLSWLIQIYSIFIRELTKLKLQPLYVATTYAIRNSDSILIYHGFANYAFSCIHLGSN